MPDLSPISPADEHQRTGLARIVEKVIASYEPRLQKVKVLIQPDKSDPRKLIGIIYADLIIGTVVEPGILPARPRFLGQECPG